MYFFLRKKINVDIVVCGVIALRAVDVCHLSFWCRCNYFGFQNLYGQTPTIIHIFAHLLFLFLTSSLHLLNLIPTTVAWWSGCQPRHFRRVVKVYQRCIVEQLKTKAERNEDDFIVAMQVLQQLNTVRITFILFKLSFSMFVL